MKKLFAIVITALFPVLIMAQDPGALDLNFNGTGMHFFDFNGDDEIATRVLVQPDQKIVVAGSSITSSGYNVAVARLFPDGSPDPSFSFDGRVQTFISSSGATVLDAAIQPDGKIIAVGFGAFPTGTNSFLVRYTTDGQLDAGFGNNGIVELSATPNALSVTGVVIDADGKVVCSGMFFNGTDGDLMTLRLNEDGTYDNSYSFDGRATVGISSNDDALWGLAIQEDGKIVGVGTTVNGGGDKFFAVIRFNVDGTVDNSFNSTGYTTIDFGTQDNDGQAIAIHGHKIIVAGKADIGTPIVMASAMLLPNGTLDASYGNHGKLNIPYYAGNIASANEIAIQQDGKILFGGSADDSSLGKDFALARVNAVGEMDNSFDMDGKVQTDLGDYDVGFSVAMQEDGKILLAGRTTVTTMDFALVRYISGVNIGIGDVETYIGSTLVFPNPIVNNTVTVEYELTSDQSVSIDLFSVSGKLVSVLQSETKEQTGFYQKTLSLPVLSAGNYVLKLNTNQGSVSVRLAVCQ